MNIKTPPMGWNTWNTFAANINEKLVMESADAMVENGLLDAGYEYVVIDDIWALKERGEDGRMVPDPEKFPHGMKYVSDYIHSKGLKFGMYSSAGYMTCAGYPASFGYEWLDAKTFAEWGVDYLKYDFCYHPADEDASTLYKRMGAALANCGRDILFSACSWGAEHTRLWIKETGAHSWRSTGDIYDNFNSLKGIAKSQLKYMEYNGQGCFNDMDMLIVGMNNSGNVAAGGCNFEEYKLHFSFWCFMNSTLMMGCDIRNMSDETKTILLNKDVIAINQDPASRQPFYYASYRKELADGKGPDDPNYKYYPEEIVMLAKYLDNGDIAIGHFNFSDDYQRTWGTVEKLGVPLDSGMTLDATELWTGEKLQPINGVVDGGWMAPHTCKIYRAKIVPDLKYQGYKRF